MAPPSAIRPAASPIDADGVEPFFAGPDRLKVVARTTGGSDLRVLVTTPGRVVRLRPGGCFPLLTNHVRRHHDRCRGVLADGRFPGIPGAPRGETL